LKTHDLFGRLIELPILVLEDELHAHPSSSTLMKQTLDAIYDVKSMPNSKASKVMTPHTLRLIDKCQAKMEELVEC